MVDDFFAQVVKAAAPALRARLSRELVTGWYEKARAAHPGLQVPPARFARHLGRHLTAEALDLPTAWLPEDLFLALGCLGAQPTALAQLDRWLRLGKRDEEVVQRARTKLLVGQAPRLETYAGRAPLKAWVGLVARRLAIDAARAHEAEGPAGPATLAGLIKATPELQLVERDAARRVTTALRAALEALEPRDRDLLRGHYLEGRTHAQLAEPLGASRSAVALWIEKAREKLLAQTRQRLQKATRLDSGELDSLLQVVESHLDLSFSELKLG